MRYDWRVKAILMDDTLSRTLAALILAFLLIVGAAASSFARSSFWISARDKSSCIVSAVFQYEKKTEVRIQQEREIENPVIMMDIHTKDPRELCSMLTLRQGEHMWRPLLCVTEVRGNIYKGHIILPEEFSLEQPISISLGQRTIEAKFQP